MQELANHRESRLLCDLEKRVIEYAVEMTRTPVDVPDALFESLRKDFDDAQLIELTAAIAWENYLARLNHALEIPAHGFSEGAFCPLPQVD